MNSENKQESAPNDTTKPTEKPSVPSVCCGIYGLRNKLNDKWYVGQSWNIYKRWNSYSKLRCKKQPKLYRALEKYGYDGFEKRVIEMCDANIPQEMLDKKETSWIKHLNSVDHGYNLRSGGSRGKHCEETKNLLRNKTISDEYRKHMSDAAIGKVIPTEVRQKISQTLKGRRFTDEHRRKIAEGNRRRVISEETRMKQRAKQMSKEARQKIRDAVKGRKRGTRGQYVKTDLPSCAPRSG